MAAKRAFSEIEVSEDGGCEQTNKKTESLQPVTVVSLGAELCTVQPHLEWSVADFKRQVSSQTGIHPIEQRLMNGLEVLHDEQLLHDKLCELNGLVLMVRRTPAQARWLASVEWAQGMRSFQHLAPKEILQDRDIQRAIVWNDPDEMYEIAKRSCSADQPQLLELTQDVGLMKHVVMYNFYYLVLAPTQIRKDIEFVSSLVLEAGEALAFAHPELRANRELVSVASRHNRSALLYAASELQEDKKFMFRALADASGAISDDSEGSDPADVFRALLPERPAALRCSDYEVMEKVLESDGRELANASDELRNDRQLVLCAVRSVGRALRYASAELRKDKEVVLAAVTGQAEALAFALPPVDTDWDILRAVLSLGPCWDPTETSDFSNDESEESCETVDVTHEVQDQEDEMAHVASEYALVGSWDDWSDFHDLLPRATGSEHKNVVGSYHAEVFLEGQKGYCFQIVQNRSWEHRYHPPHREIFHLEEVNEHAVLGPSTSEAEGYDWRFHAFHAGTLQVVWRPIHANGIYGLQCNFSPA